MTTDKDTIKKTAKISPIPWEVGIPSYTPYDFPVDDGCGRLRLEIKSADGAPIASFYFRTKKYAKQRHPRRGDFLDRPDEAQANAQLMAASPDLADSLMELLDLLSALGWNETHSEEIDRAVSALEKAGIKTWH